MTRALLEIAEYFETINEEASKMELLNWNIFSQKYHVVMGFCDNE